LALALLLAAASSCWGMPPPQQPGGTVRGRANAHGRAIAEAKAAEDAPAKRQEEWSWDDIESEQVEERNKPFQSMRLAEVNGDLAKLKQAFGSSKHKKHHRHDLHQHLPKHPHNRTGGWQMGWRAACTQRRRQPRARGGNGACTTAWPPPPCHRQLPKSMRTRVRAARQLQLRGGALRVPLRLGGACVRGGRLPGLPQLENPRRGESRLLLGIRDRLSAG
jgi:hypothetical protein